MRLEDRRVLVIGGGGGGIGRAMTRAFGSQGAAVAVADRDPDRAAEAVDELRGAGATAVALTVAKAGLLSLARTVAAEYSADGIRMNVVVAGAIATPVNPGPDGWVDPIPLGRYGRSDEVAEAAVYLASDAASYVTGQQLVIDGGVSARGPFG